MYFSMYATIKFNRPINKDTDYVSPGSYEIVSGDKTYRFDFETYYGNVDAEDNTILHIECMHPDGYCFEDIARLTKDTLAEIKQFSEFIIYINASDLTPIALMDCDFVLHDFNNEVISLSENVCSKTKFSFSGD